ncbi:MAG TPA: DUF3039 domain-containing protein [Demequina sp.]|nr:DUF3039 domain-containing protein [Demequina sp.]
MSETTDAPTTGGSLSTIERTSEREAVEPGDAERFSHYVRKEKILESAMTGDPVIALCGKVWTPGRDPKKFPVCPACKEILDSAYGSEGPSDD